MLRSLYIQHYALISSQKIDFQSGFSSITGETGAGKSIILGALGLIMGDRADARVIANGQTKCVVEADFDIRDYQLDVFFDRYELDNDDPAHCILRREVTTNGKSRAFINDSPVSLTIMREMASYIIDIHSQHENLLINNDDYQRDFVDLMAQNKEILTEYRNAFYHWKELTTELATLRREAQNKQQERDYIQFQWQQLSDANLVDDELQDLEEQQQQLLHAEDIKITTSHLTENLQSDEGLVSALKSITAELHHLAKFVPKAQQLAERVHSAMIEIDDIASEIADINEHADIDPQRLEYITRRIDTINTLLRKHNVSTDSELIIIRDQLECDLDKLDNIDQYIATIERQCQAAEQNLLKAAHDLTQTRMAAAPNIAKQLTKDMATLGVTHPNIQIAVTPNSDDMPADKRFTPSGQDNVSILFSANLNQPPMPVKQVASGGEIARLMLCVKALMAHKRMLPTIIFDEIDTGISGDVAVKVGNIMSAIAKNMQVLAITHLPQIAAKALQQYRVYKTDDQQGTTTHIEQLDREQRVNEIATMLSGTPPTAAALSTARELLDI